MKAIVVLCAFFFLLVSASDKDLLMQLFTSTNGNNWKSKDFWGSDKSICTWFGVTCGDSEQAIELNLENNGLQGELPSNFGDLSGLQRINFLGNSLSGKLPDSIGNLQGLQSLVLSHNQFSGSIPSWIGDMKYLQVLSLDDNKFESLANFDIFKKLCNLQQIYLGNNQIIDAFPTFCTENLEIFDASENPWGAMDVGDEFDQAANLKVVNFNGIQPEVGWVLPEFKKSKLQKLFAGYTSMYQMTSDEIVKDASQLEVIYMSHNQELVDYHCAVNQKDYPKLQTCDLSYIPWLCPLEDYQSNFCNATCVKD